MVSPDSSSSGGVTMEGVDDIGFYGTFREG